MLTTLIRRELLDNLMTFRFAAAVFILLLTIVATTPVLIKDYEQRVANYNTAVKTHRQQLQNTQTYSMMDLFIDRPPNPLSLFNVGLDKRLGNKIKIAYVFVPTLWDATMNGSDNPFLSIFTSIDISFILEVILSLLALIFAYDTVAREHEHGTLRLVLTNPVGRGSILFAKYISAMFCLIVPFLMSMFLALIMITVSDSISLIGDDFLRIGGIVFTSLAYLSVFYLIGMLISAATRRTSTAIMLSIFVWGFWVFVYPNMILAAIETPPHAPSASALNYIKQLWEELDKERKHILDNDPVPGADPRFNIEWSTGYIDEHLEENSSTLRYYYQVSVQIESFSQESEPQIPHAQNYYRFLGPRTIKAAEQTWHVRKQALESRFILPANVQKTLLKLSPCGTYDAALQAWSDTDLRGIRDFFDQARQYRESVLDYFYEEKAFESRQWFASDKKAVDWDTLPQFFYQRSDARINATRALPDICILLITNLLLFLVIFLVFLKSEV